MTLHRSLGVFLLAVATQVVAPAQSDQTTGSQAATVTGRVVDAACFMLHPAAAMSGTHKECGAACLARGVPLAVATDEGALYFPADGNKQLKRLLNARVRVTGPVVQKNDSMELKMPVGDKNEMTVRIDGGYKQITIQKLTQLKTGKS